MFLDFKRKYLARCEYCQAIFEIEFWKSEDLAKIDDDTMVVECTCGGDCIILKN